MRMCVLRTLLRFLAAAVVVATPAMTTAQVVNPGGTQVPPPRDRVPPPATGTGVIKGRVVDGVTGAAIARARVRLLGPGVALPSVLTDATGAFVFRNVPSGGFSLGIDKSTYRQVRYPEPGRTIRSSMGKPIMVAANGVVDNLVVPLYRGGAITGHVLDANGDPLEFAQVQLMRQGGGASLGMRGSMTTNDIGEFRFGKLEPGVYLLMAVGRNLSNEVIIDGAGRPVPPGDPPPQAVPTYYPNAVSPDLAQPVRLERGQSVADVDITLAEATAASTVSGTAVGEDGLALTGGGFLMVRAVIKDVPFPIEMVNGSIRPDGTFRFTVPPGEYVVEARGSGQAMNDRFGILRVSVSGNVEGLTLPVGRGASASGRVVFEGTTQPPAATKEMQFSLFASEGWNCRQGRMTLSPDWTFTVEGLAGTCSEPSQTGFLRWMLKSIQVEGEEFRDTSITFQPGQRLKNVVVTFTDRRSSVAFRVADAAGQATREYVALLFQVSKDQVPPSSVRVFTPPSDEMLAAAAANTGRAVPATARREAIPSVRPGDYYAIALDDLGTDDLRDPVVLARLLPAATRVTVGEVDETSVTLRRQNLADLMKR